VTFYYDQHFTNKETVTQSRKKPVSISSIARYDPSTERGQRNKKEWNAILNLSKKKTLLILYSEWSTYKESFSFVPQIAHITCMHTKHNFIQY
jgi:hypothetical protein